MTQPLTAQIRAMIYRSPMKVHEIALKAGISPPQLYRFMTGERGLSLDVLDKVGLVLELQFVGLEDLGFLEVEDPKEVPKTGTHD
jgi:transcriptional regulator with XRE-family HTH domain